jgi:hypothetical protein
LPGRGLASAAALIAIALVCLTVTRKLERERRLLAKLRKRDGRRTGALNSGDRPTGAVGIPLDELSEDDRDAAESLAAAGVLEIQRQRVSIKTVELGAFRKKRLRLMVTGGFGAFLLACLVALLILRR